MKHDENLYIKQVQGHQRRFERVVRFTNSSTKAAAVMLLAAIAALLVANFGDHESFLHFWHTEVTLGFGEAFTHMSLAHIINDVFMAIFFLLVGLEIKYEMTVGELTNIRQALLPIIAAAGGVVVPVIIYVAFNLGSENSLSGWGVPTATDIAFALGIMALLGDKVPRGVKVFLSTLAVADDIIAIIVIAVFYGNAPSFEWLAAAAVVLLLLVALNRAHVYSLVPYLALGVVLWVCVFSSGVHATIAGVLLAFTIPTGSRVSLPGFLPWSKEKVEQVHNLAQMNEPILGQEDYLHQVQGLSSVTRQALPPALRLEHALNPWVNFAILPLFALTNADVALSDMSAGFLSDPVLLGVFFGLLLGKPIGIVLLSVVTVKLKIASLPKNTTWMHMLGAGILGGVGFTMAIFVANLAFADAAMVTAAKVGILSASALAGIIGFVLLFIRARKDGQLMKNQESKA